MSELVVGSLRGVATATNQDARQLNLRATLRALASGEARTRADLARVTGLTRPTISSLVAELVADGLVVEVGIGASAGGKPPTLLEVDPGARQVIAVDISRRPVVATLSDLAGEVMRRETAGTPTTTGHELLEVVADLVQRLADAASAPVAGIGIGTPGLVGADGVVIEAPNLAWHEVPLAKELSRRTGLPTWVDNDADAAALAEYGSLPPDRDGLVLVRISAGVGAGLILGGRPYAGARAAAGEIGHLVVDPDGAPCSCGNRGCLETLVSVPAIIRRAAAAAGQDVGPDQVSWRLDELRDRFGAAADTAVHDAGVQLGAVLAHVVAVADVTDLVLSLELDGAEDALLDAVRDALHRRLLPGLGEDVALRASALGADLVLHGAHALVLAGALGMVREVDA